MFIQPNTSSNHIKQHYTNVPVTIRKKINSGLRMWVKCGSEFYIFKIRTSADPHFTPGRHSGLYKPHTGRTGCTGQCVNHTLATLAAPALIYSKHRLLILRILVVDVNSVNLFKARLHRFWKNQDVKYDFTADLTGAGDR